MITVRIIGYRWYSIEQFNTLNDVVKSSSNNAGLSYVENLDENGNIIFLYCGVGGCPPDIMPPAEQFDVNVKISIQ